MAKYVQIQSRSLVDLCRDVQKYMTMYNLNIHNCEVKIKYGHKSMFMYDNVVT